MGIAQEPTQTTGIIRGGVAARLSQFSGAGNLVFLAGQVPDLPKSAGCGAQAAQVLQKMDRLLAEAGSDKSRLLHVTVYLADLSDFAEFNQVWDGWVVPGQTPPRACVEARLANPEWLVEVVAIGAR